MAVEFLKRIFGVSYAKVLELGDNMRSAGVRDQLALNTYGITTPFLTELQTMIQGCIAITPDGAWVAEVAGANQAAYAAAAELRNHIRGVVGRAEMKFKANSWQVAMFNADEISQVKGYELLRIAHNSVSKATILMPQLVDKGMTQDVIDALSAAETAYQNALQVTEDKRDARRTAGQERIAAFNELYVKISELALAGKLKFEFTDAARYVDYLLTESDGGNNDPLNTPVITSIIDGIMTISGDPEAVSHDVEESLDQSNWTETEYDVTDNTLPVEPPITGVKYFRVRSNAPNRISLYSPVFALQAMLDGPSNPHFNAQTGAIEWGAATNATEYDIRYRPAGSNGAFTDVANTSGTNYPWTPPVGEWEFQMRSLNAENTSPWVSFLVTIE